MRCAQCRETAPPGARFCAYCGVPLPSRDHDPERVARPAFRAQTEFRQVMRKRIYEEQGALLKPETSPAARNVPEHSLLYGSPATVAEKIAEIDAIGVGGLILAFRIGPMPGEVAEQSIRLFMQHVAPEFRSNVV